MHRLILLPVLLVVLSCETKNRPSDFKKFTGRWSLYVVERQKDSSASWEEVQNHYKNRQGFIIYDGKGGMGVHHVTDQYETYVLEGKGGLDSLTKTDLRHLANNFVYFGKYVVKDSQQIIEHHIESTNFPYLWGTVASRNYVFSGDTLVLYPVRTAYPKVRLKWVRLNDRN